jgi:hypothetical protein
MPHRVTVHIPTQTLFAPHVVEHFGMVQSMPPQPTGHEQVSLATHRPPFSQIKEHTAEIARIRLFPVSATYTRAESDALVFFIAATPGQASCILALD